MYKNSLESKIIGKYDMFNILISIFLLGGDHPTLLSVAASIGMGRQFLDQCRKLKNERTIFLESANHQ